MIETPTVRDVDYSLVYEPSEDTFLMLDCLEEQMHYLRSRFKQEIPLVTEAGTGTGMVATFIQKHILPTSLCLATDINPNACQAVLRTAEENRVKQGNTWFIDSLQMDLTSGIRLNCIDILLFNPPYVPAEQVPSTPLLNDQSSEWLDRALLGGTDGMEITWKLLDRLEELLEPSKGVAYVLFCARNRPSSVALIMRERGWYVETVMHRRAGWEVLDILRFSK